MSKSVLIIRNASEDDVPAIHQSLLGIGRHIGEEAKIKSTPQDLEKAMFAPRPLIEGVVAEIDRQYAGMCLFFRSFSSWLGKPGVYVQDLWVEPQHRKQRVGERLVQHVAALTSLRDGVYMRLSVETNNALAIEFYEGLGLTFSRTEQIQAAYGDAFQTLVDGATS